MLLLGIDPGKNGGLAIISTSPLEIVDCISVPHAPEGSDDLLDVHAILSFIQRNMPDLAFIERVSPMPSIDVGKGEKRRTMGATSAFNFGGAVFTLRTCVVGLGIQPKRVEAAQWKKVYGLSSKDPFTGRKLAQTEVKERSRQAAIKIFGDRFFPNKGHHNRAEAALIANYGRVLRGL